MRPGFSSVVSVCLAQVWRVIGYRRLPVKIQEQKKIMIKNKKNKTKKNIHKYDDADANLITRHAFGRAPFYGKRAPPLIALAGVSKTSRPVRRPPPALGTLAVQKTNSPHTPPWAEGPKTNA